MAIQVNVISENTSFNVENSNYCTVALPITACWGPGFTLPTAGDATGDSIEAALENTAWSRFDASPDGLESFIATYRGPSSNYRSTKDYSYFMALSLLNAGYAVQTCRLCPGTNASVTDTRKTLPGLRALQKYAVTVGGGKNHRFNLSDAAMLKDNHIDAYGGITAAVSALREKIGHTVKIEVEVRTLDELKEALENKVEIIMLDNMNCEDMKKAVEITDGKALLEASGNVTADNIREVAETGVNIISIGALTHSVKCFDISMKIKK
jgi:hypothetical protein